MGVAAGAERSKGVLTAGFLDVNNRAVGRYHRPPMSAVDILIGPDVFVNASVAGGSPPEQLARRVLGKPQKPKTTAWVLGWVERLLAKAPGFKIESLKPQVDLIKGLVDVVDMLGKVDDADWTKGLVASAKAAGVKTVVTDHPDLADKAEVDGIRFLSTEAWLLEQTTPPPPPPPKKK